MLQIRRDKVEQFRIFEITRLGIGQVPFALVFKTEQINIRFQHHNFGGAAGIQKVRNVGFTASDLPPRTAKVIGRRQARTQFL